MKSEIKTGFNYLIERFVDNYVEWEERDGVLVPAHTHLGRCVEVEEVHNLMPIEGLNHMHNVTIKGAAQVTEWFIGLTTNDYAPLPRDTMATYPTLAGETTSYAGTTRLPFVAGTVAGGVVDNVDARAEFVFTAPVTVRGGFIASTSTRGLAAGVLLSAVRFASPKVMASGETLRITAGNQLTSA